MITNYKQVVEIFTPVKVMQAHSQYSQRLNQKLESILQIEAF